MRNIGVDRIKDKIISFHSNARTCFEIEFSLDIQEILPYNDIMLKCIGENFLILMKFYDSILDEIRSITIEKIKVNLRSDFCHNNLIACLKYFEFIDFYMKKLFDIEKAIQADRDIL